MTSPVACPHRGLFRRSPGRAHYGSGKGALPSGVLAEQMDPETGHPLSATPLAWSHATVLLTLCVPLLRQRDEPFFILHWIPRE